MTVLFAFVLLSSAVYNVKRHRTVNILLNYTFHHSIIQTAPTKRRSIFKKWISLINLQSSWISQISTLKSCSSILPASNRQHLSIAFTVSAHHYNQWAIFMYKAAGSTGARSDWAKLLWKTTEQTIFQKTMAAVKEMSMDAAKATVLSILDSIFIVNAEL